MAELENQSEGRFSGWWLVSPGVLAIVAFWIIRSVPVTRDEYAKSALDAIFDVLAALIAFGPLLWLHYKALRAREVRAILSRNLAEMKELVRHGALLIRTNRSLKTITEQHEKFRTILPIAASLKARIGELKAERATKTVLRACLNTVESLLNELDSEYEAKKPEAMPVQRAYEEQLQARKAPPLDEHWARLVSSFPRLRGIILDEELTKAIEQGQRVLGGE